MNVSVIDCLAKYYIMIIFALLQLFVFLGVNCTLFLFFCLSLYELITNLTLHPVNSLNLFLIHLDPPDILTRLILLKNVSQIFRRASFWNGSLWALGTAVICELCSLPMVGILCFLNYIVSYSLVYFCCGGEHPLLVS